MWQLNSKETGVCHRFVLADDESAVQYGDALNLFCHSQEFRQFFIEFLRQIPFNAYRWETPPFSAALLKRDFEFVVLSAPSLDRPASASAFANQIANTNQGVVTFANLGKDAHLVVPSCTDSTTNYCHIGSFSRTASFEQQDNLWAAVGEVGLKLVSKNPIWLSTAGGGVPWLHVRFDSYPKYYGHAEYKKSV